MADVPGPQTRANLIPIAYLAIVALAAVLILPTALRPPPPETNASAEFSPDAPPDENVESIIANLQGASSRTAGGTGDESDEGTGGGPAPSIPTSQVARACPGGFGDPPRQIESVYSAPCATAWSGDNGGSTWRGVTADEIRFVETNSDGGSKTSYTGRVSDTPRSGENDADRTWRVMQAYFNRNYQLYGRKLQFYVGHAGGNSTEQHNAAIVQADKQFDAFAVHNNSTVGLREAAQRKMLGLGGFQLDAKLYTENFPYLWNWWMDGTRAMAHMSEYVCKRLSGHAAAHAGPELSGDRRTFGLIVIDSPSWGRNGFADLAPRVREMCDEDVVVSRYAGEGQESNYASTISQFRVAGVTSIILATDPIFINAFLQTAEGQAYVPEWIVTGMWLSDWSVIPNLFGYSKNQWAHTFGLTTREMARPERQWDHYRAYRSIESEGTPEGDLSQWFETLVTLANGIQLAGPDLTPTTFAKGLMTYGVRDTGVYWRAKGGFRTGDLSYIDDVAEIFWENGTQDPATAIPGGAYRYANCGERYGLGEHPNRPADVFGRGCLVPPGS